MPPKSPNSGGALIQSPPELGVGGLQKPLSHSQCFQLLNLPAVSFKKSGFSIAANSNILAPHLCRSKITLVKDKSKINTTKNPDLLKKWGSLIVKNVTHNTFYTIDFLTKLTPHN